VVNRIALAILVGLVVGIVCLFGGGLLATLQAPPMVFIGNFLVTWCWVIGVIAGAFQFFRGGVVL
jgi:hypothetical protein